VTCEDGKVDGPSERVVEQRVRNRVIEYLELTSSLAAQADYEKSVPIAYVPYEVINQWEDQLPRGPHAIVEPDVYTGRGTGIIEEISCRLGNNRGCVVG